jgi:DnaA family protein
MHNHPRDPASLLELVARVDSLSLREQRQPTIPLIRRAMQSDA